MWRYLNGMYPDRNWRVFLYDFPGMERKRRSGNSEEHSGHTEGCMIKERNSGNSMAAFRGTIRANKGIELDVHLRQR